MESRVGLRLLVATQGQGVGTIVNDLDRSAFCDLRVGFRVVEYSHGDKALTVRISSSVDPIERGIWPKTHGQWRTPLKLQEGALLRLHWFGAEWGTLLQPSLALENSQLQVEGAVFRLFASDLPPRSRL